VYGVDTKRGIRRVWRRLTLATPRATVSVRSTSVTTPVARDRYQKMVDEEPEVAARWPTSQDPPEVAPEEVLLDEGVEAGALSEEELLPDDVLPVEEDEVASN